MGEFGKLKGLKMTIPLINVGPLGLEPRLFGTKNRRVASYTMGQKRGKFT